MIDFHPWPSRRADTEHPDELRIDIDPQPGTDFGDAKKVAALVQEVLAEIGYTGWPKTSGNRGIHVACRIEPRWEFPVVRRCALAFAREIERRAPELVTTAWWKEERGERVFIDYNQNARDRTIASAYSVRARRGGRRSPSGFSSGKYLSSGRPFRDQSRSSPLAFSSTPRKPSHFGS